MEEVWPFGVLVVLLIALFAFPGKRSWRFVLAPFVLPAALAITGVIDQATTDQADCYEECGYVWVYLYAAVAMVPAAVASAVIGAALGVRRRRRHRRAAH